MHILVYHLPCEQLVYGIALVISRELYLALTKYFTFTSLLQVQSQQLSHSFAPMNNKNRRFIHELAAMYGCSSISYDQEPNRNTVVTANKYVNFGKFVHFSLGNFALCVFIKNKVKTMLQDVQVRA